MNVQQAAVKLAADLTAAGLTATADPRKAATARGRGIVFVPPPRRVFRARADEWTLVALSGRSTADLETFEVLAVLVETLQVLLPIEEAEPSRYQLVSDQPPYPAYLARCVTSIT